MKAKEATARIKINELLKEAGWRFFDDENGPANIILEPNTKITESQINALGEDFQTTSDGFIDFLLLGNDGRPLIVLEAKSESKNPLSAKEQARRYAREQNARFVILSNGNIHYLWDLEQGNPSVITKFPSPDAIKDHHAFKPDAERLANELIDRDFIALTQMPNYANEAGWKDESERDSFIEKNKLRFLRDYQKRAVQAVQRDAKKGAVRFLFEMATGTGKTLTSAAIIKLFLKTGNARRVLFLVDRIELEVQADKAFKALLKNDFTCVIYKEQRDDWRKADIVVTTVQSLLFNDKFQSPKRGFKGYESFQPDAIAKQDERQIGSEGMRIDRELFQKFEDMARSDQVLADMVEQQNWEAAVRRVVEELFDKPDEYFNLDKLRRMAGLDRRLSVRELLEKAFGHIPRFKSKDELIDDEFQKFLLDQKPEQADRIAQMRYFFDAYIKDAGVRKTIDDGHFTQLNVNPIFGMKDLKEVPPEWRKRIPEYIKDYVSLNRFLP